MPPGIGYECPKKSCTGRMEYVVSTRRGDKYECKRCGENAWYEGAGSIPGM